MNKPPFNPPHQSLRAQTSLPGGTNDFVRGRGFRGFQGNQSGPRGFDSRRASTGGYVLYIIVAINILFWTKNF